MHHQQNAENIALIEKVISSAPEDETVLSVRDSLFETRQIINDGLADCLEQRNEFVARLEEVRQVILARDRA